MIIYQKEISRYQRKKCGGGTEGIFTKIAIIFYSKISKGGIKGKLH